MTNRRSLSPVLALSLLAACAAPGTDVVPRENDFALVEVKLRG